MNVCDKHPVSCQERNPSSQLYTCLLLTAIWKWGKNESFKQKFQVSNTRQWFKYQYLVHRYECTLNEEKAAEKRDEIKKGFDDLKKELADFTGK